MKVIAVITNSHEVSKILESLKRNHTPPFDKVEIKPAEQIPSSSVQSTDDIDATYRKKNGNEIKGQSVNVIETAHPDNQVNLITDDSTHPVNKDDSKVLNERLDTIKAPHTLSA